MMCKARAHCVLADLRAGTVEIHRSRGSWVIEMLWLRLCFEVSECVAAMPPASNLR